MKPTNRHNHHATQRSPRYRNILQWETARAKYEYRLRQGAPLALDYAQMCCGRDSDTAIKEIESVIQFHLKEWEERTPNPKEK